MLCLPLTAGLASYASVQNKNNFPKQARIMQVVAVFPFSFSEKYGILLFSIGQSVIYLPAGTD